MNPNTPDSNSDLRPDDGPCAQARDGFAAYVYGELEGPDREQVEAHLGRCADCAACLSSYRETLGHLDDWKLPTQARPENPAEIAARIRSMAAADATHDARALAAHEAQATPIRSQAQQGFPTGARRPQARLVQLSARLTAIAAAVLVTFSILGAEVSSSGGQFHLRLSMPWSTPRSSVHTPEVQLPEQQVRRIAADEFSNRASNLERRIQQDQATRLQQYHTSLTRESESERERFALVVDRSQEEHRRAIVTLENFLTQLRLRQEQLDQRTRDALVDLTEAVLVLSE